MTRKKDPKSSPKRTARKPSSAKGAGKRPSSPKGAKPASSPKGAKPASGPAKPGAAGGKRPALGPERLQKLLARAGFGSRRASEELIGAGRVEVNGAVVTELGTKADPIADDIRIDGRRLREEAPVYYLVNKPKSVVCTTKDPQGRPTIIDLIPHERRRIFSVGRLDYDSRGAVILTNDGRLTNLLTHPRYGVEKTYQVRVRGLPSAEDIERLRQGIWLSEGRTLPARVWVVKKRQDETELGLALCEGKNRQVRRMLAKIGYKVLGLTRTRIGPLTIKGLGDGGHRPLQPREVDQLIKMAQENAQAPASAPRGHRTRSRSQGKPDPAVGRGVRTRDDAPRAAPAERGPRSRASSDAAPRARKPARPTPAKRPR